MAFAVTGSFKAIEQKSDIVGVIILSIITGLAGGIILYCIWKISSNSNNNSNVSYYNNLTESGIAIFFLYPRVKKHWNLFIKFDAIGLGVFTVIGATVAYTLYGHNFLVMAFAGVLTAIGGGILRDVFVNQIPIVFIKGLYVLDSFIGILLFYILLVFNRLKCRCYDCSSICNYYNVYLQ